jgi:hypothetical protein
VKGKLTTTNENHPGGSNRVERTEPDADSQDDHNEIEAAWLELERSD